MCEFLDNCSQTASKFAISIVTAEIAVGVEWSKYNINKSPKENRELQTFHFIKIINIQLNEICRYSTHI